jgi:hypothetical protein
MLPPKLYMDDGEYDTWSSTFRGLTLNSSNLSRRPRVASRVRLANENAGTPASALPLTRKPAQTTRASVA